jgi:hypothetical protein
MFLGGELDSESALRKTVQVGILFKTGTLFLFKILIFCFGKNWHNNKPTRVKEAMSSLVTQLIQGLTST